MPETKRQIISEESQIDNGPIIPRLSPYIEIHSFDKGDSVIRHITLGYRVKVSQQTVQLLDFLDGQRTIDEICFCYRERYHIGISSQEVYCLLFEKLASYGIIEQEDVQIKEKGRERHLWLSFIFLKKNAVMVVSSVFSFLFTPLVFYFLFFAMFVFLSTVITLNFNEITSNTDKLFSFNIFYYLLAFELGSLFHEIGHASACRRYGASPGGIGFGFYLFLPVLFSDVSDVWRLKPKERVIVNIGGIYFEMILASLMLIAYYISNDFALLVIPCALIINTLWNLNPFVKYDGYWILSDALGIPNLHKNANKTFVLFIKNLVNRKLEALSVKDFFLVIYELTSKTYILILLMTVLFVNPDSIIYFPVNVYIFIKSVLANINEFTFSKLSSFIIPGIFYILVFQFILGFIKSKMSNKKK
jgi:putative peptide zinc metalloprotease protein